MVNQEKKTGGSKKRRILTFLGLAFGISWAVAAVLYLLGIGPGSTSYLLFAAFGYMTAPGVAALIVDRKNFSNSVQAYGLSAKKVNWKSLFLAITFYMTFLLLALFLIFLLGNVFAVAGSGSLSFDQEEIIAGIAEQTGASNLSDAAFPPVPIFIIAAVIGSIVAGFTVNLPFALGEELGWRGFLTRETAGLGFWQSNLLIGIIWGVWHFPLIWLGHNYRGEPLAGSFMMVLFCISLSPLHGIVRWQSGTVLIPAALHGMINAGAPISLLFIFRSNLLLGSVVGIAGVSSACIIAIAYIIINKRPIKEYRTLS